jgi:polyhydroxybutyrate depolymerase
MNVRGLGLVWLCAGLAVGACGSGAKRGQLARETKATDLSTPSVHDAGQSRTASSLATRLAMSLDAGATRAASSDAAQPGVGPADDLIRDAALQPTLGAAASGVIAGSAAVLPPSLAAGSSGPHVFDDLGQADDAGAEPAPECSGKPGAPGNSTRMANSRSFIVHIPPQADPNRALPLMFVFHGANGHGSDMQTATGFDTLADMQPVVMVYPDGAPGNAPWNVGRNVCAPGNLVSTSNDDIAYLDAMLDDIERDQCIARGKVFATGFSMGGYFTNELGCQLGRQRLRAIAPHSGGTHSGTCPGAPLPVLLLHGDADSLINYRCGTQARDYWVQRNGCSEEFDTLNFTGGACTFQRGCASNAPVALCTFQGMDHTWAYPPMYDHSSWLIWAFFSPYL